MHFYVAVLFYNYNFNGFNPVSFHNLINVSYISVYYGCFKFFTVKNKSLTFEMIGLAGIKLIYNMKLILINYS